MARTVMTVVAMLLAAGVNAQICGWEWVNPTPPRCDVFRLKQETGIFVGVGADGNMLTSRDGFSWVIVDSGVDGDLFGVDWGAGTFVVAGEGAVLKSINGTTWSLVYEDGGVTFLDVEFSASRFVAVGAGLDGNVLTSPFGFEWVLVPVPWIGAADSVTGSDDGFYISVGAEIWYSPDGFDWEYEGAVPAQSAVIDGPAVLKASNMDLFELDRIDLAWSSDTLLWAGGSELWSRNSEGDWSLVANLGGCNIWRDWLGVIAGPGWAMASGISGCPSPFLEPTVTMARSTDGGKTFPTIWETDLGGFPALTRFGSRWVALGAAGDLLTSSNGSTWECPHGGCTSIACADGYADLVAGASYVVAVGGVGLCDTGLKRRAGKTSASSADGVQWTVQPAEGGPFRGVTWTGTEYLGVGAGWVARSSNGSSWTSESFQDGASLHSIATGGGSIVTVGRLGALYVSTDGVTWRKPFLYLSEDLDRVVFDGEQFFVLGRNGTILRSPDAANWFVGHPAVVTDFHGMAAGPAQRIVVGNGGVILGSEDGNVWLSRLSGVDANLTDVTWGDDQFLAVGWEEKTDGSLASVVLGSHDGDRWTRFAVPGPPLERVIWDEDAWLAVGRDRAILRARCPGTMIEIDDLHLQVPLGGTTDLLVQLSDVVGLDTTLAIVSSVPDKVVVPSAVTVLAESDTVVVPVSGAALAADAVLTFTLPDHLGGGTSLSLATVQPPEGRPRRPSGRVEP